jgi:hypothetical protein
MEEKEDLQVGKKRWRSSEGIAINSRGSSGGICTMWDQTKVALEASLYS